MKAAILKLQATCFIEVTEKDIAFLEFITSYDNSAKVLQSSFSEKYTLEEVKVFVEDINSTMKRIMHSTGEARRHIFDERYYRNSIEPIVIGHTVIGKKD